MKKLQLTLLLICLIFLFPTTTLHATFRLNYDSRVTNYYDGVRHTEYIGTILYDDEETLQKINYLGANPTSYPDLNIITADNYLNYSWGKGDLATMVESVHLRYDNYHVIGGVNGDFYGPNGIPIEAFVRNFEVLSWGLGNQRPIVGFKDDGTVVFGQPCWEGYEAIVFNDKGQIKHRFPIENINQYPVAPGAVSVFFEDHTPSVTGTYNKLTFGALELKLDEYQRTYFGKGVYEEETTDDVSIGSYSFVLVGTTLNSDDLFTEGDSAVVQQKMGCEFEDVRFAVGAWEQLVYDGVVATSFPSGHSIYRHPRTAIGVKADGTVFFVTVDGRDYENGYRGVTNFELAELMFHFDAVEAYNLDGGGSTAMIVEESAGNYVYLNTPSDGQPRQVSNGLFFVRGEHEPPPVKLPYPDDRVELSYPMIQDITTEQLLLFEAITGASSYDVEVDGTVYTTLEPQLQLDLTPGLHFIRVKANGDYTDFRDSDFSPQIIYVVYSDDMRDIIEFLKQMAKK